MIAAVDDVDLVGGGLPVVGDGGGSGDFRVGDQADGSWSEGDLFSCNERRAKRRAKRVTSGKLGLATFALARERVQIGLTCHRMVRSDVRRRSPEDAEVYQLSSAQVKRTFHQRFELYVTVSLVLISYLFCCSISLSPARNLR